MIFCGSIDIVIAVGLFLCLGSGGIVCDRCSAKCETESFENDNVMQHVVKHVKFGWGIGGNHAKWVIWGSFAYIYMSTQREDQSHMCC